GEPLDLAHEIVGAHHGRRLGTTELVQRWLDRRQVHLRAEQIRALLATARARRIGPPHLSLDPPAAPWQVSVVAAVFAGAHARDERELEGGPRGPLDPFAGILVLDHGTCCSSSIAAMRNAGVDGASRNVMIRSFEPRVI